MATTPVFAPVVGRLGCLLVEAAWHRRRRYRPGRELIRRQDGQPPDVRARTDQGNRRLHRWPQLRSLGRAQPG